MQKTVWAITPEMLTMMLAIAKETNRSPEAIAIDALADVFINKVAAHRNISPKEVIENFGGGDVFVGQNAVRIGLADGLASFEAIVSDLNNQSMENIMEEQKINASEIKAQERMRMSQVLSASVTRGKEQTAELLLSKTDLAAADIIEILETVPSAKENNSFEIAMAQMKNPSITPATEDKEETTEDIAARIASYTLGDK